MDFMNHEQAEAAENRMVLCAANAYEEKYYFNAKFARLPESIKRELQIISVLFTEEIGGVFALEFDTEGNLLFRTEAEDYDYNYDDIGAGLMIKEIQKSREELLASLELYYKVFILHEPVPAELLDEAENM